MDHLFSWPEGRHVLLWHKTHFAVRIVDGTQQGYSAGKKLKRQTKPNKTKQNEKQKQNKTYSILANFLANRDDQSEPPHSYKQRLHYYTHLMATTEDLLAICTEPIQRTRRYIIRTDALKRIRLW